MAFTARRMSAGMLPYCPLPPRAARPRRARQPLPALVQVARAPLAAPRVERDVFDGTAESEPRNTWSTITTHAILALAALVIVLLAAAARGAL